MCYVESRWHQNWYFNNWNLSKNLLKSHLQDASRGNTTPQSHSPPNVMLLSLSPNLQNLLAPQEAHRAIPTDYRPSSRASWSPNWTLQLDIIWQVGCPISQKKFSVIDQKLTFGERFSCLHFLEGKNAQNRPENQQNWKLAKIAPKSDKFTKSKPWRPFLGNVWTIKVVLEFWFGHLKCHFFGPKTATFGKILLIFGPILGIFPF